MRLPSCVTSIGKIKLGSALLMLYGFFSMLGYFILRGLTADLARQLYSKFKNEPDLSIHFKWVLSSRLDLFRGLIFGLIAAAVVAVLILIVVNIGLKKQMQRQLRDSRPAIIAGILVLGSYFIVFVVVSFFVEPILLTNSIDFLLKFSIGAICFLSAEMYIDYSRFQKERRDFIKNEAAQLKKLELEFVWGREMLHLATWVLVTMMIGGIVVALLRYFYEIPVQVRACPEFRLAMLCNTLGIINIGVGFSAGIIYQLMRNMEDVVFAIKDRFKPKVT